MATDYARGGQGDPTVNAIERAVAYFFGMRVDELHQKGTARAVKVPRQIVMYLIKEMTDASVPDIGRYYGNKHFANVKRAIAKLEEQRCKRSVVDLVIRELVEKTGKEVARDRRRLSHNHRRPM